ncbi:MAG TPA: class II fructose-bisphosphate aldolase [Trueperaceae bacterium]
MPTIDRPKNLRTFSELAPHAEANGYAIGAFSPRYPLMIPPVLRAAERARSPLLVQISQKDMSRCGVEVERFAEAFRDYLNELAITVPVGLHLDHTHDEALIERALEAGFTSVMIDASDYPLEENIRVTRRVADRAHARGASVEGELGTIGATSFSEAEERELVAYTDPDQVEEFVAGSDVDALAVSVGTVHGVGRAVTIDIDRLAAIRERTSAHLVLHGGSGVDAAMMRRAIRLPGGGVSKVNLATDLEVAMLAALNSARRVVDDEIRALPDRDLRLAQDAVEAVVIEKIEAVLGSAGRANGHPWEGR